MLLKDETGFCNFWKIVKMKFLRLDIKLPDVTKSKIYENCLNSAIIFREDDFNDPIHLERISTLNTFSAQDLGGFSMDRESEDYTRKYKTSNEWLVLMLLVVTRRARSSTKIDNDNYCLQHLLQFLPIGNQSESSKNC